MRLTLAPLLTLANLSSCVRPPSAPIARFDKDGPFDGADCLERLAMLVGWPRALGDDARVHSIERLKETLEQQGASVRGQPVVARDPQTGHVFELENVVARFRPRSPVRFVLATHFDTRPWADEDPDPRARMDPIPGANDGTSGLALLLELAPLLDARLPSDVGFAVILFDGEELGHPGEEGYCAGSRHFATVAQAEDAPAWIGDIIRDARFGIVVDMVGDRELRIRKEQNSLEAHPELLSALWTTARAHSFSAFVDGPGATILDDHVFLTAAGVPSVLLIDLDYPPWHTHLDTVDQLSATSLAQVGNTMFYTIMQQVRGGDEAGPPGQARTRR